MFDDCLIDEGTDDDEACQACPVEDVFDLIMAIIYV
jgi:hypothetical protein